MGDVIKTDAWDKRQTDRKDDKETAPAKPTSSEQPEAEVVDLYWKKIEQSRKRHAAGVKSMNQLMTDEGGREKSDVQFQRFNEFTLFGHLPELLKIGRPVPAEEMKNIRTTLLKDKNTDSLLDYLEKSSELVWEKEPAYARAVFEELAARLTEGAEEE